MVGISSTIGLDAFVDDRELRKVLNGIEGSTKERALFDDIGAALHTLTMDRFLTSTAPDGSDWKKSKRAERENGKTLVDETILRDSFTWDAGYGSLDYGTEMIYAAIHQKGGDAGRNHSVHLDAREMLPEGEFPVEYMTAIGDVVIDHIAGSIG